MNQQAAAAFGAIRGAVAAYQAAADYEPAQYYAALAAAARCEEAARFDPEEAQFAATWRTVAREHGRRLGW